MTTDYSGARESLTHKEIRSKLRLAASMPFALSEWREACELARDNGWTESQVNWILFWWSPFSFFVYFVIFFISIASLMHYIGLIR